jgi:hypothetical protein
MSLALENRENRRVAENIYDKRIEIGRIDYYKLHLWLQKITMTQKKITIKSSDSIRGQVWLKGNQTFMEFDLV